MKKTICLVTSLATLPIGLAAQTSTNATQRNLKIRANTDDDLSSLVKTIKSIAPEMSLEVKGSEVLIYPLIEDGLSLIETEAELDQLLRDYKVNVEISDIHTMKIGTQDFGK
jgi:hypothetical protein